MAASWQRAGHAALGGTLLLHQVLLEKNRTEETNTPSSASDESMQTTGVSEQAEHNGKKIKEAA